MGKVINSYNNKLHMVIPKHMQDHIVDAVQLLRAPVHDVEPWGRDITQHGAGSR